MSEKHTAGVAVLNKELDKVNTKMKTSQSTIDGEKEKIEGWKEEAKQIEATLKLIKDKGDDFEV